MKKYSVLKKLVAALLAVISVFGMTATSSFALALTETGGADVYIGSDVTHYDNLSEAWNKAVSSKSASKLVLREDWTADANGNFGKGKNFIDGSLSILNRKKNFTLDLNGYKIDRGLTKERKNGAVFYLDNCKGIKITDSSEAKTGVITGGFNNEYGGAVVAYITEIVIENVRIENNRATKKGGAIWGCGVSSSGTTYKSTITLDNCLITGNRAKTGGGIYIEWSANLKIFDSIITKNFAVADAGVHTEVDGIDRSFVILGGKVIIADNITEKDGVGLMLDENFLLKVYILYDEERPLEEGSRIVILSKTDDKTLRITEDSDEYHTNCYEYENDSYEIIEKGTGSEKYLDIKKAA